MVKLFIEFKKACNLEKINNFPFLQEKNLVEFSSGTFLLNPQFFKKAGFVRFVLQKAIVLKLHFQYWDKQEKRSSLLLIENSAAKKSKFFSTLGMLDMKWMTDSVASSCRKALKVAFNRVFISNQLNYSHQDGSLNTYNIPDLTINLESNISLAYLHLWNTTVYIKLQHHLYLTLCSHICMHFFQLI